MGCTAPRGQHCTGPPTPTLHCVLYPTWYSCVCASSTNNATSSLHLQHCSTLWVGLHLEEHCGCATTGYIQHCSTLWHALHLEEQQRSIKIICCIVGPSLLCLFCLLFAAKSRIEWLEVNTVNWNECQYIHWKQFVFPLISSFNGHISFTALCVKEWNVW